MPFTISHAVVALPFRPARWLVPSGIAAGAMAPDVPLFAPNLAPYAATHEIWAAPTIDVLLAYVLLAGWSGVIRVAVQALAPRWVALRLPAVWRSRGLPAPSVALAVSFAIGALTHVTWDAFTHRGRLGSVLLPALATHIGPLAITSLLQYASSIGGFTVLTMWAVRALRRTTPEAPLSSMPTFLRRSVATAVLTLAIGIPAAIAIAPTNRSHSDRAFTAITGSIDILVLLLCTVSLALGAWALTRERGR